MLNKLNLPNGLYIRPARDSDKPFIASLFESTRDDLLMLDADPDYIQTIIEQQHQAQTVGYGNDFPNAMYFIVEQHQERIGRIVIDFGKNEIRMVDFCLIPQAQGKGYGKIIIQILQYAAGASKAPLTLSVMRMNERAKLLYFSLGFQVEETNEMYDRMVWYPSSVDMGYT